MVARGCVWRHGGGAGSRRTYPGARPGQRVRKLGPACARLCGLRRAVAVWVVCWSSGVGESRDHSAHVSSLLYCVSEGRTHPGGFGSLFIKGRSLERIGCLNLQRRAARCRTHGDTLTGYLQSNERANEEFERLCSQRRCNLSVRYASSKEQPWSVSPPGASKRSPG